MITNLNVRRLNTTGVDLSLPINSSSTDSRYVVEDIEGLTPVKSSIVVDPLISNDGGAFRSSRVDSRNIVLYLGYNKLYSGAAENSIQSMRNNLYAYFLPGTHLELSFLSLDKVPVNIEVVVESFESVLFSKEPRVQISMIAPDPYFKSVDSVTGQSSATGPSGTIQLPYSGDVPTPVDIRIPVANVYNQVYIRRNAAPATNLRIDRSVITSLTGGEVGVFFISSFPGRKGVTFRSGVDGTGPEINVLSDVVLPFAFPMVNPGSGSSVLYSRGSGNTTPIVVTYNNRYGGL